MSNSPRNWFEQGGQAYAQFRPEYPAELATYLASLVRSHQCAVDVGCGNGQLTKLLAQHFECTIGFDPSAEQIANATPLPNVRYLTAAAEQLSVADASAHLICAAQAAHWFDLPKFYAEVTRIAASDAVLALISYGVLNLEADLDAHFQTFYWQEMGTYWPAERRLVDEGYKTLEFPFTELSYPAFAIQAHWNFEEFVGYILTWSAVRKANELGYGAIVQDFLERLEPLWGSKKRLVSWPINMRIARIS